MKYRVIKEISLLTLAQAGPKGCKEFRREYESLVSGWKELFPDSCGFTIDKLTPHPDWFFEWAEKDPKRIAWLIEKGFAEKVEPELKPCPFHQGDKSLVVVDEDRDGFYIRCKFCYARGPNTPMKTDAINGWNRRV